MPADVDASEVRRFAGEMRQFAPVAREGISRLTAETVQQIAVGARSAAPTDRPWLSTTEGIRTDFGVVGGVIRGSVYSPRDPSGQSVGYRQEYGTSTQAPQPFLMSRFRGASIRYMAGVERIISGSMR